MEIRIEIVSSSCTCCLKRIIVLNKLWWNCQLILRMVSSHFAYLPLGGNRRFSLLQWRCLLVNQSFFVFLFVVISSWRTGSGTRKHKSRVFSQVTDNSQFKIDRENINLIIRLLGFATIPFSNWLDIKLKSIHKLKSTFFCRIHRRFNCQHDCLTFNNAEILAKL